VVAFEQRETLVRIDGIEAANHVVHGSTMKVVTMPNIPSSLSA
jgi:hypothetical protein